MHPGGSAFAGYQAFSPTRPAPLSGLVQQHSAPVPRNEDDAGDEEVQVNNRVAGGAGKRLSVEDLQVCISLATSPASVQISLVQPCFWLCNCSMLCVSA